jgi:hypothetical protein
LFYSSWRKTLFVEGFYYHAVLDFRHCSSSTPCPTGTSASSILEHVAVCSWYINLTIDGAVYVSQHFPFGAAFVCQAGNFWTLLHVHPWYCRWYTNSSLKSYPLYRLDKFLPTVPGMKLLNLGVTLPDRLYNVESSYLHWSL